MVKETDLHHRLRHHTKKMKSLSRISHISNSSPQSWTFQLWSKSWMPFPRSFQGRKQTTPLPMSLPALEELNDRWSALENKAAVSPQNQDPEKLHNG